MDDLLADFLTETHENLEALDTALVRLERAPDDTPTLSEVFRRVHTIKGTCGFLGLPRLEATAHAAETVLGHYRDGTLAMTQDGISWLLQAMDRIRGIVQALETTGAEPAGRDTALIAALGAAVAAMPATPAMATQVPAKLPVVAPARTMPALAMPARTMPAPTMPTLAMPVRAASVLVPPVVTGPVMVEPATLAVSWPSTPPPAICHSAREFSSPGPASRTVRVPLALLDDLTALVAELALTHNRLLRLARGMADGACAVPLQRLSRITSDLQEGVMKTRQQPVGDAWARLPRLARDLGIALGKRIELELHGGGTKLDRQALNLVRDPLIHLVRNAGDHGLETPPQHRASGKPEVGTIRLSACCKGGHILIKVSDDGCGLDLDRIRAKVLALGLTTEAELAAMPARDVQRFIFRAGFSTAAVTAVSGQGVGLDVARTNVERGGGTIEVHSQAGQGTTFIITIPLNLAILSASPAARPVPNVR